MLFSSKPKPRLAILLDVQSSIVRGALVRFHPSYNPEITFLHSHPIAFRPGIESNHLVKLTLKAVNQTVDELLKEIAIRNKALKKKEEEKISEFHYILSSPWIVSQAKTVHFSFPQPTKLTKEKIRAIVADERNRLLQNDKDKLSVIEEKIFDVRLNGYPVPQWEARIAHEIETSFVVSVAGTRTIEEFRTIAHRVVSPRAIHFHSSLLLQNIGIQTIMPERSTYALVHVHGELTDIVVVHKHSCVFFGSYPFGVHTLIRKISQAAKIDAHAAESLLTMYMNNHLDPSHTSSQKKIIEDVAKGWIHDLQSLFDASHTPFRLPRDIIFSAKTHDEFFRAVFKNIHKDSHITILSMDDILRFVSVAPHAERLRVLGLCVSAIHTTH